MKVRIAQRQLQGLGVRIESIVEVLSHVLRPYVLLHGLPASALLETPEKTAQSRAAVTERRITHCDWHDDMQIATVVLQVKRSGTNKYRPVPMKVSEFIRRYLQHVLPRSFQKVRHFGFLHPGNSIPLLLIHWLVAIANQRVIELCQTQIIVAARAPSLLCRSCGGMLICKELCLVNGIRINVAPPEDHSRGSPAMGGVRC
jgi:hypothetical protein